MSHTKKYNKYNQMRKKEEEKLFFLYTLNTLYVFLPYTFLEVAMRNTEKEGVAFSFPQDVLQIKPNRITDLGIIHYFQRCSI